MSQAGAQRVLICSGEPQRLTSTGARVLRFPLLPADGDRQRKRLFRAQEHPRLSRQTGRKMKPQKPRASRKKANVDAAALKIA